MYQCLFKLALHTVSLPTERIAPCIAAEEGHDAKLTMTFDQKLLYSICQGKLQEGRRYVPIKQHVDQGKEKRRRVFVGVLQVVARHGGPDEERCHCKRCQYDLQVGAIKSISRLKAGF